MYRRWFLMLSICMAVAAPLRADDWKFDVLHLKNGDRLEGLIVQETRDEIDFKRVTRKPGVRTLVFQTTYKRTEIDRIERLTEVERQALAQRLEQLDPRGEREAARMKAIKLQPTDWPTGVKGLAYAGPFFHLVSNAREDIVRRVIVRLEDIFEAYGKHLGTRRQPERLTRILLCRTLKEYQERLKKAGWDIINPAHYDPQKNEIVAASDLERLADELDKIRRNHDARLRELQVQEKKLRDHYQGRPPAGMLARLQEFRDDIRKVNVENENAFERGNRRLFSTLYHEAFHAYLDSFLYPTAEVTVPRWLNEGLAQIFETALVETGDLRVGHIDPDRLTAVKEAVRQRRLPALSDLLVSEAKHFQVAHVSEAQASDRYFLASWALAYYLTFDRKLLGSERLDRYVQSLRQGTDPVQAFRDLTGQPLAEFEAKFQQYLLRLRPDGTLQSAARQ